MRIRLRAVHQRVGGPFLLLALLALAGCASSIPQTERVLASAHAYPKPVELDTVPFYPQEAYQCGPAALAMVLQVAGVDISPEQLVPQVYLPSREGSLQIEMLAAARRQARVPYVLQPHLEALLTEVASGTPVLILQNLGLSWYPKWHYAVVVGFNLPQGEIVLRSGLEARHTVPLATFERTWARGRHWAMVVLPPGKLPETAEETPYLAAVVPLERLKHWREARQSYEAALKRWPRSQLALLGLGNTLYALEDKCGALKILQRAAREHPGSAAIHNNLAHVTAELGGLHAAEKAALRAAELEGEKQPVYRQTLEDIRRQLAGGAPDRSTRVSCPEPAGARRKSAERRRADIQ